MPGRNVRWAQTDTTASSRAGDSFNEENSEIEDVSEDAELCLTMMCSNGRLACSYFDAGSGVLYTMEDTDENYHYDLTARILEQLSPTLVLTSSKADELFMDMIRDHMENIEGQFQVRPWKEFTPTRGLVRLKELPLLSNPVSHESDDREDTRASEPANAYEFMRQRQTSHPALTRWTAGVKLGNFTGDANKSPFCYATIGALLDHLTRLKAARGDTDDVENLHEIKEIEYLVLEEFMQINADALVSLQIFLHERHASVYSDAVKEGLSIYGILNQTRTPAGAGLLRQWLLRPSTSLDVIRERHNTVECLIHPDNISMAEQLRKYLGGLKGGPRALARLRKGKSGLQDWRAIVHYWVNSSMLRTGILDLRHASSLPVLQHLVLLISDSTLVEAAEMVDDTIDWEESVNLGRVTVKPMVDEQLDNWKEELAGMDSLLSQAALVVAAEIPDEEAGLYAELNVIYFPQLGYLIAVPICADSSDAEQRIGLNGWKFQFMTEESVYFKSEKMEEMDRHLGDINTLIISREIEILQILSKDVLKHADSIMAVCERAAILDCLLCFAAATNQHQWTRPTMTDEIVIDIHQGRHPLQELVDDRFVANDTYAINAAAAREPTYNPTDDYIDEVAEAGLEGGRTVSRIVICTGANASGKSVYLKQCALIPYMAQIGCFVPAASARLGIIEKVFTRIQTRESVSKVQSAFMIDLNQVSLALRNTSTPRTLLILDEFGKGTLASDGAGLFTGVIKHLLNLGDWCPLVFAATHFHEVLNTDMLSPSLPISFVHMAVMITTEKGDVLEARDQPPQPEDEGNQLVHPGEAVTYLFKVSEGLCLNSHASKCALTWGIPPRIVQRAEHVSELLSRNELNLLLDEQMSDKERDELVECEAICQRFMEWDLEGLIERREFEYVRPLLSEVVEGSPDEEN